ncbi:MAG TPA: hypothetical protein VM492_09300 [Sumerlaeia bacterium]|nr:hypothetical protein [Sumerlaeia bacterium]
MFARRILRRLFCAVIALPIAAAGAYCWVASRSTGYEAFESEQRRRTGDFEDWLRQEGASNHRQAATPNHRQAAEPDEPSHPENRGRQAAAAESPQDFMTAADDFDRLFLDLQGANANAPLAGWLNDRMGWARSQYVAFVTNRPIPKNSAAILEEDPLLRKRVMTEAALRRLLVRSWHDGLRADPGLPHDAPSTASLHAALDRVERFLLESSWEAPDFHGAVPSPVISGSGLFDLTQLAAIRACFRGEGDKAVRLLAGSFEVLGILYRNGDFPIDLLRNAQGLAAFLSEFEAFPDEGFSRAQEILSRMVLPSELRDQFNAAYMLRERNRMVGAEPIISAARAAEKRVEGGRFSRLARKTQWAVLEPIARRRIESAYMAYIRGEADETRAADLKLRGLAKTCDRLGVLPNLVCGFGFAGEFHEPTVLLEQCDDEIRFLQMTMAAARHRRAHGRFPSRIEELAPFSWGESLADESWAVLLLEPCELPVYNPEFSNDLLWQAVRKCWTAEGRLPSSPRDLEKHVSDPSVLATFEERFEPFPETFFLTRFCGSRSMSSDSDEALKEFFFIAMRWFQPPTPEEKARFQATKDDAASTLTIVVISMPSVERPWISEDLAEMLRGN